MTRVAALAAALLAAFFAGGSLAPAAAATRAERWAWAAALLLMSAGEAALFFALGQGWTHFLLSVFLLAEALVVALLALGSLYLLVPRAVAHVWAVIVSLAAVALLLMLAAAGVTDASPAAGQAAWQGLEEPGALLGLSVALRSLGILILLAAAAATFVYVSSHRRKAVLAAVGALVAVYGADIAFTQGGFTAFAVMQAVGGTLVFAGIVTGGPSRPAGRRYRARH